MSFSVKVQGQSHQLSLHDSTRHSRGGLVLGRLRISHCPSWVLVRRHRPFAADWKQGRAYIWPAESLRLQVGRYQRPNPAVGRWDYASFESRYRTEEQVNGVAEQVRYPKCAARAPGLSKIWVRKRRSRGETALYESMPRYRGAIFSNFAGARNRAGDYMLTGQG